MSELTLRGPVKKERPAPLQRSVERKSLDGTVLSTVALEPSIFGIEPHMAVLHQVVTAQLAAKRAGTQSTKTRSEVRGGGRKPFRQKGTGGARQGSIRSPHYPGGGIALGPKPRSYEQKVNKKMVRLALNSALSDRASEGRIALVEGFGAWQSPRTKDALAALSALELFGKVLVVLSPEDTVARYSFNNLDNVRSVDAGEINAYDVLDADWVLFSDASLPGAKEAN